MTVFRFDPKPLETKEYYEAHENYHLPVDTDLELAVRG
jgi:hypothetical protein